MGRKNRNAGYRRPKREWQEELPPTNHNMPRTRVEDLVLPDGRCYFGNPRKPKLIFLTEEKAARALAQAQALRARTGSGKVEKRYYPCPEGGCGGYHLSSREEWDPNLYRGGKA